MSARILALAASVALLSACGGGGDGASAVARARPAEVVHSTLVSARATAALTRADATTADALVALVDRGAENWAIAQLASASLLGAGTVNVSAFGALAPARSHGAGEADTESGGVNPFCGSGSVSAMAEAALVERLARDGRNWQAGDRFDLGFNRCTVNDGGLGLAQLPDGVTLDGDLQVAVARYHSAADYAASFVFSNWTMTRAGSATRLRFDRARFSVDYTPGRMHTVLDTGSQAYVDGVVVVLGQVALVTTGVWRTLAPSGTDGLSGWLDVDYANWRHDRALQRATQGTVQIAGAQGEVLATIAAAQDGAYRVALTLSGTRIPVVFDCAAAAACTRAD